MTRSAASPARVTDGKTTVARAKGKVSLLNHPRLGETMATAAMMAYAYGQIDPARTELNAVSLKIAGS